MTEQNPRAFCIYYDGNDFRIRCRVMSPSEELPLEKLKEFFNLSADDDIHVVLFDNTAFDREGEEVIIRYTQSPGLWVGGEEIMP